MKVSHIFDHKVATVATSTLAVMLTACGGGGGGSATVNPGSTDPEIVAFAGDPLTVPGQVTTKDNLLRSIVWQAAANSPIDPTLILANDACGVVDKTDTLLTVASGTRTGSSKWICNLGVITPTDITADALYALILTGTDDLGNKTTARTTLRVKPRLGGGQSNGPTAAGKDVTVAAGTTVPLFCNGPAGVSYQWTVVENAGMPVQLSSNFSQATSYVASYTSATPAATPEPKRVVFACRMTDSNNRVTSSQVAVTVTPPEVPVLVTSLISTNIVIVPGATVGLNASAGFFDKKGAPIQGDAIRYQWIVGPGAPAGVVIDSANALSAFMRIPSQIVARTTFPVTFAATSGTNVSTATGNVTVDPLALRPSVLPVLQTVTSGATGTAAIVGAGNLFYQWSVVSGPSMILAGDKSATVNFIAPTLATTTPITLRVAASYAPITAGNPGQYFLDSVVQVTPTTATAFNPLVTPSAQTVVQGTEATVETVSGSNLYYQWTQKSGPTVALGGTNTKKVGFIAPVVASPTTIVLTVAVSSNPITASNVGTSTDAVIVVTP